LCLIRGGGSGEELEGGVVGTDWRNQAKKRGVGERGRQPSSRGKIRFAPKGFRDVKGSVEVTNWESILESRR